MRIFLLLRTGMRPKKAWLAALLGGLLVLQGLASALPGNQPPRCSQVSPEELWPANHDFRTVEVPSATDPEGGPVQLSQPTVRQDEPVDAKGNKDGSTSQDARMTGGALQVRAERNGNGDGRVYHISITATDSMAASTTCRAEVEVPPSRKRDAVDQGPLYDSFEVVFIGKVPGAPRDLTARSGPGVGDITLDWLAPESDGGANVTHYRIYRRSNGQAEQRIAQVGNVRTYRDKGRALGVRYFYRVSAVNKVGEGPRSNEASAVGTSPVQPDGVHSDDCAGGTTVVDGYVGDAFLRLEARQVDSRTVWLCARADVGSIGQGAKVVVAAPGGGSPPSVGVDESSFACRSESVNDWPLPMFSGVVGDPSNGPASAEYHAFGYLDPDEVWLCARVVTSAASVNRRVVLRAPSGSQPPEVSVLLDEPGAGPPNEAAAPGKSSGTCQNASFGRTRVLNADIGDAHVWVYSWRQSDTRAHLCARVDGAADFGGRLTVDASGLSDPDLVLETSTGDMSPCTNSLVHHEAPTLDVRYGTAGTTASVCVNAGGSWRRVTVGATGGSPGAPSVTFTPDS